ncbi:hypothetical protein AC7_A0124 [Clostridium perfringens NCTC 8239]|nr:hypothetical protein AC7_A0124 [Clostridium perfringens NCTC 8239]
MSVILLWIIVHSNLQVIHKQKISVSLGIQRCPGFIHKSTGTITIIIIFIIY